MLHDCALYKFIIDIDIEADCIAAMTTQMLCLRLKGGLILMVWLVTGVNSVDYKVVEVLTLDRWLKWPGQSGGSEDGGVEWVGNLAHFDYKSKK